MDLKPIRQVLSFKKAKEVKSFLVFSSALSLLLFVILPFFSIGGNIVLGYETFYLYSGFTFYDNVGPAHYDLRWLVLTLQIILILDVVFSLLVIKVYNVKLFYQVNIAKHTTKIFVTSLVFVIATIINQTFFLSSLLFIIILGFVEYIYDVKKLRQQVYERYQYIYPYRFMFFTTILNTILIALPFINNSNLINALVPNDSSKLIEMFPGVSSVIIFVSLIFIFIIGFSFLGITQVISFISRSFVNKLNHGFDFWRSLVTIIFLLPIVVSMYAFNSPLLSTHLFTMVLVITFLQLVVAINAKYASKKAEEQYKKSISENPWRARYSKEDETNVEVLPIFISISTLLLCFLPIIKVGPTYSIFDISIPLSSSQLADDINILSVLKIVSVLALFIITANVLFSFVSMYIKFSNKANLIRFSVITIYSIIMCILFAIANVDKDLTPLFTIIEVNAFISIIIILKDLVFKKRSSELKVD